MLLYVNDKYILYIFKLEEQYKSINFIPKSNYIFMENGIMKYNNNNTIFSRWDKSRCSIICDKKKNRNQ